MNYGNCSAVANSWRSTDGGLWWVNDVPYGEPNGDYSANCLLSIWASGYSQSSNPAALVLNDNQCNYWSGSYYLCSTNDQLCAPGSHSATGFGGCSLCPPGSHTSEKGATSCATCPAQSATLTAFSSGGASSCSSLPSSYIGCFSDTPIPSISTLLEPYGARLAPYNLPRFALNVTGGMSIQSCQMLAAQFGAPYFALQSGTVCFGAFDFAMATSSSSSISCTMPCSGDSSQICGGSMSNSLYYTQNASFLGCYQDIDTSSSCGASCPTGSWVPRVTGRRVSYLITSDPYMSADFCNNLALLNGFAYMAVQAGICK